MQSRSLTALVFLTACTAHSTDDVNRSEQAFVTSTFAGICNEPVPSADGRFLLLNFCPQGGQDGRVAIAKVGEVTLFQIATYPRAERVVALGENGNGYYVATSRGGGWDLRVGRWSLGDLPRPVQLHLPESAAAPAPTAVQVSQDGKRVIVISGPTSNVVIANVDSGEEPTTFDLQSGSRRHRILMSSEGEHAAIVTDRNGAADVVQTLDLDGTPRLGQRIDFEQVGGRTLEAYDGDLTWVVREDDGSSALKRLGAGGGWGTIARGDLRNVTVAGDHVWYSLSQRTFDDLANRWVKTSSIYRVPTRGSQPPRRMASSTEAELVFEGLGGDGTWFLYRANTAADSSSVWKAPLDGSAATKTLSDVKVYDHAIVGDRHVIVYGPIAHVETVMLDAHGVTLQTWPRNLFQAQHDLAAALSADGATLYTGGFDATHPPSCSGPTASEPVRSCVGPAVWTLGVRLHSIPKSSAMLAIPPGLHSVNESVQYGYPYDTPRSGQLYVP